MIEATFKATIYFVYIFNANTLLICEELYESFMFILLNVGNIFKINESVFNVFKHLYMKVYFTLY